MHTLLIWTIALGFTLTLTSHSLARPQEQAVDVEAALEVLLEDDTDNDGTPESSKYRNRPIRSMLRTIPARLGPISQPKVACPPLSAR